MLTLRKYALILLLIFAIYGATVLKGIQSLLRDSLFEGTSIPVPNLSVASKSQLPPLKSLIRDNMVQRDVQFLFDFAIVGFAKTGTTSLMNSLSSHPEILMENVERNDIWNNPIKGIQTMYKMVEQHGPGITGYKGPHIIQNLFMLYFYQTFAPRTKLIVSVRHPVLWFESYYNYRVVNRELGRIKGPPNNLTIDTSASFEMVNAATGAFHRYLAHLGKTSLGKAERELLEGVIRENELKQMPALVPNPVMLLETRQLSDSNPERSSLLLKDMQAFLGLQKPLEPLMHTHSYHHIKEKRGINRKVPVMDICEDEFVPIRTEMMRVARNASVWIRDYFVKSNSVTVSSPQYFDQLLLMWMHDPCKTRRNATNVEADATVRVEHSHARQQS